MPDVGRSRRWHKEEAFAYVCNPLRLGARTGRVACLRGGLPEQLHHCCSKMVSSASSDSSVSATKMASKLAGSVALAFSLTG